MKTKLLFIALSIIFLINMGLYSQEQCKVLLPDIAKTYVGKCKKGLAHGKGVAEGTDKYEGFFKNGLPHGVGKYTWAKGDMIYEGDWKEGKKDGKGKLFYKINGADSMKYGVWKNDSFVKRITPSPYKVIRSSSIQRYAVRRNGVGSRVLFSFNQFGKANATVADLQFAYSSGSSFTQGLKQGVENIVFPFTCRVSYKAAFYIAEFEIEFREAGDWEVVLFN